MTIKQAIDKLKSAGIDAEVRVWAPGETIMIFVGGRRFVKYGKEWITTCDRFIYLCPSEKGWYRLPDVCAVQPDEFIELDVLIRRVIRELAT